MIYKINLKNEDWFSLIKRYFIAKYDCTNNQ